MIIYLVQTADCLEGTDGYSSGLLEAGHKQLLVSFMHCAGLRTTIMRKRSELDKQRPRRAPDPTKKTKPRMGLGSRKK